MDRDTAERLVALYLRLVGPLNEAASAVGDLSGDAQKRVLRSLAQVIGRLSADLLRPIVQEYPDLDPNQEVPEPAGPMSPEEAALVSRLTDEDLRRIDDALLAEADVRWRKVARVVGTAMGKLTDVGSVPDVFYAQRVRVLVEAGRLESQGNLDYMRLSEVRLPESNAHVQREPEA